MQDQGTGCLRASSDEQRRRGVEMAIVSVLGSGEEPVWFLDELEREIGEDRLAFDEAFKDLQRAGVVRVSGDLVMLSRAARRVDELESSL